MSRLEASPRPAPAALRRYPASGVTASGQQVIVTGINIFGVADGKVTHEWSEFDGIGHLAPLWCAVWLSGCRTHAPLRLLAA